MTKGEALARGLDIYLQSPNLARDERQGITEMRDRLRTEDGPAFFASIMTTATLHMALNLGSAETFGRIQDAIAEHAPIAALVQAEDEVAGEMN